MLVRSKFNALVMQLKCLHRLLAGHASSHLRPWQTHAGDAIEESAALGHALVWGSGKFQTS